MKKILFICHGNICRSPMAEFMFKKKIKDRGLEDSFLIRSAATSTEEIGNPVYPSARAELAIHGISCEGKTACQVTKYDGDYYDYLICMDHYNVSNLKRMMKKHVEPKIFLLMEFIGSAKDVADPWYTNDFKETWDDIDAGLDGFLIYLGVKE